MRIKIEGDGGYQTVANMPINKGDIVNGTNSTRQWVESEMLFTGEDYTGFQKIAAIKAVRQALGLGLKEAKDLVEALPKGVTLEVWGA